MRLTISSKANQRFIKDLSQRWGMTERETIDYLLTQTRLNGISTELPTTNFVDNSVLETNDYQETVPEEFTPDPMIERLIAAGLDLDF
ncbi:MAG: hypothetical protein AAF208_06745 [Cyanobacteria bacterium P01_A01_bin.45]